MLWTIAGDVADERKKTRDQINPGRDVPLLIATPPCQSPTGCTVSDWSRTRRFSLKTWSAGSIDVEVGEEVRSATAAVHFR
jgi:hypothetical protein